MYLRADSQSEEEEGESQEFASSESQFRNKYIFESQRGNQNKYHIINPNPNPIHHPIHHIHMHKKETQHRQDSDDFATKTSPEFHFANNDQHGLTEESSDETSKHTKGGSQAEHLKLLLEREIEKNKELQKQLFLRERELIDLRCRERPVKKPPILRVLSPPTSHPKSHHLKSIQTELSKLKSEMLQNSSIKQKYDQSKQQNKRLKKANKKYGNFVSAIAMSIGIMTKDIPPKGVTQTWKAWKDVFNEIAKQNEIDRI